METLLGLMQTMQNEHRNLRQAQPSREVTSSTLHARDCALTIGKESIAVPPNQSDLWTIMPRSSSLTSCVISGFESVLFSKLRHGAVNLDSEDQTQPQHALYGLLEVQGVRVEMDISQVLLREMEHLGPGPLWQSNMKTVT
eukprot:6467101-Amphidinium_carterae.4